MDEAVDSCVLGLWMLSDRTQGPAPLLRSVPRHLTLGGMELRLEYREFPSLFKTAEGRRLGFSAYALKNNSRCRPLFRGVRINEDVTERRLAPSWADDAWVNESVRLRGAQLLCPTAVGIGPTAARLLGLPLPRSLLDTPLQVASSDRSARLTHPDIVFRRLRSLRSGEWLDLQLQLPGDLFIDLAPLLSRDELIAVGDAMVGGWHGPPMCSLSHLRETVAARRYLRARSTIQEACRLIRETVDSPQETDLRLWIISKGLPEPRVHPQVFSQLLGRIVEPDLGYEHARLALEYEGAHHFESKAQWTRDISRDEALRAAGWTVLKVTSQTNRRELELEIRAHLAGV